MNSIGSPSRNPMSKNCLELVIIASSELDPHAEKSRVQNPRDSGSLDASRPAEMNASDNNGYALFAQKTKSSYPHRMQQPTTVTKAPAAYNLASVRRRWKRLSTGMRFMFNSDEDN